MLQAVSAVQDGSSPSSDPGVLDLAPPPSPVLRIIIDNMFYPVTLDVLQQVDADLQQQTRIPLVNIAVFVCESGTSPPRVPLLSSDRSSVSLAQS